MGEDKMTLKDAVYGVAIGDALGVPVQFKKRDTFQITSMIGYGTDCKPAGTWSDDTSLTIATCDSIRQCGGINISHMKHCFQLWYKDGAYTPTGEAFDIGRTTEKALKEGRGQGGIQDNGNGSLMRIIPLAFLSQVSQEEIRQVSSITHSHPIATDACVIYVTIAQALLRGMSLTKAIKEGLKGIENILFADLPLVKNIKREEIKSTGYVIDTLYASLWSLLNARNFEEALLTAVNLGGDSDTIGAVTGGLAGIMYGLETMPKEWIKTLRSKNVIDRTLF